MKSEEFQLTTDRLLADLQQLGIVAEMTGQHSTLSAPSPNTINSSFRDVMTKPSISHTSVKSGHKVDDHFEQTLDMVEIGSGVEPLKRKGGEG